MCIIKCDNTCVKVVFLFLDVEKRENPVCHFVTPLDGSMDLDVHRPAEVNIGNI